MISTCTQSEDFHEFRKDKIGASDAPIIMGESPFKTPRQLWEEKLGLRAPTEETAAMTRGKDLEEEARKKFEETMGIWVEPSRIIHSHIPYMFASLDGIDPTGSVIVEIKCPGKKDHAIALGGKIPPKYYGQMQHQLECTGLEMGFYYSYDGKEGLAVMVHRDDAYIKTLLTKEAQFYEYLIKKEPPPLTDRDRIENLSKEWNEVAEDLKKVSDQIKELKEMEEQFKKALIDMAKPLGISMFGNGILVQRKERPGGIDEKKLVDELALDLANYRKNPISYWEVRQLKKESL